jgi:hypothetical protein
MASGVKKNKPGSPVPISQLLTAFLEHKKWHNRLELHAVFMFWNDTVGKEIAAVAQPSLIRGNTLWVKVADSVWMQQLQLQKMLLLDKINQQLSGAKLSDIHLQLDISLHKPPKEDKTKPQQSKPAIDKKKEQEFDHLIDALENDAIKASLKSLWLKLQERGRG